MRLITSFLAVSVGFLHAFAPSAAFGQSSSNSPVVGIWQGHATVREAQQVPIVIRIEASGSTYKVELLNGPADHPDATPASSATFDGAHLIASFDYFARTLDATLADGKLSGTYGPAHPTPKSAQIGRASCRERV